jgi:deoxyribonuclease V
MRLPIRLGSKFSVEKAHAMQLRLHERVIRDDSLPKTIRYVGGVDVAYERGVSIGACAILNFSSLSLVESKIARVETRFPYVPTFLSFREIPPAISAIRKLETQPDVFLVDGQGVAHPYRFGFAAHLGVVIDRPTIGVAKSRLCGEVKTSSEKGWMPLIDGKETIGGVVVTKQGENPVYVSVGHKVSLERAIEVVTQCTRGYRVPEPTRRAHILATKEKRRLSSS